MRVRDVMTQHPVCCHAGDSAQSVAKALRDKDIGSLPVVADLDSRRLVGIITDRDLCYSIVAAGVRSRYADLSRRRTTVAWLGFRNEVIDVAGRRPAKPHSRVRFALTDHG